MFQVGSACYASAAAANSATASAQSGAVVSHSGTARIVTVSAVDGDSITYTFTGIDGSVISQTVQHAPQPCGLLTASDGLQIAWLIAGAWIATFAVMFIARALRGETESNYGNT